MQNLPVGAISRETLRHVAPSVFATSHAAGLSNRYKFIPTIDVIDLIADQGFFPVKANQTKARTADGGEWAKHMIRFRHEKDMVRTINVGGEVPELILTNAHNGLAGYNFMAGIFRLVCSNGLVVASADFGSVKVRHVGAESDHDFSSRVIEATYEVVNETPRVMNQIDTWRQITLSPPEQTILAESVLQALDNDKVNADQILRPRRGEDRANDLWTVSNRVQENLIKGGIRSYNPVTGRRNTTRAVRAVDKDLRVNKAIWSLTESMAKLKTTN